jgi:hypothetical protein
MLVGSVCYVGLFTQEFYNLKSTDWLAQLIEQDIIDLSLVMPWLLISAAMAYGKYHSA